MSEVRATRISFDEVTEAALTGVLRALAANEKSGELSALRHGPIICGIWIMPPGTVEEQQIMDMTKRVDK